MDKTQQRIKIAGACGWANIGLYDTPTMGIRGNTNAKEIPDYLNDLNSMHEAEKVLRNKPNKRNGTVWWYVYETNLSSITGGELAHATAEQRAEAFLRTLGLWED